MSLTDKALEKLPLATDGQYIVRDTELKGFLVVVGKRRKTFTVKGEGWKNGKRKPVYAAIGRVGDISARDARLKAKDALIRISKGLPAIEVEESEETSQPTDAAEGSAPAVDGITLWSAWERYLEAHLVRKNRSARTIASYTDHVGRILLPWRDTPLMVLGEDPSFVATRHDEVSRENGPYIANGAMRTLRAIYNHARKTHRYLPADNPVDAIDWNEEVRRDTGMGLKALPAWFDELYVLDNPIRREFHLFSVLSGCRPGALKVAEVEHLDLRRRVLHIPAPKGGAKKAFDIPLSRPMIRCLIRAIRLGRQMHPDAAEQWIFAADSLAGHLVEQKEDRDVLSKYGNDLRQTFRTIGQAAEVSEIDIHILMNHSLQGVNAGYITRSALLEDHLRRQQERISRAALHAVETSRSKRRSAILRWLQSAKAELLAADDGDLQFEPPTAELTVVEEAPANGARVARDVVERPGRPAADASAGRVTNWAGDVVGSSKLDRDFGIARSTLHGWQKQHRVVSLLTGLRKHVFPVAQFVDGRPVEGLSEVIAAAGSPRAAWVWLVQLHSSFGAQTPLDRLKAGDVAAVVGLAEREFRHAAKAA
jgi:hypothetical protein